MGSHVILPHTFGYRLQSFFYKELSNGDKIYIYLLRDSITGCKKIFVGLSKHLYVFPFGTENVVWFCGDNGFGFCFAL